MNYKNNLSDLNIMDNPNYQLCNLNFMNNPNYKDA